MLTKAKLLLKHEKLILRKQPFKIVYLSTQMMHCKAEYSLISINVQNRNLTEINFYMCILDTFSVVMLQKQNSPKSCT